MPQPTAAAFRQFSKKVAQLANDALSPVPAVDDSSAAKGYFCTAWRIDGREKRELFIEVPGPDAPNKLRVGLYFRDSAAVTKHTENRTLVVRQLQDNRQQFSTAKLSLTSSAHSWDEPVFGWTKSEIQHWLAKPTEKDLVWLWDLKNGFPLPERSAKVLRLLAPLWRVWNTLGTQSPADTVDEGARVKVVHELALRNKSLVAAARRLHGTTCVVCGFNFENFYGPWGRDFIEVHHKKGLAKGLQQTSLNDLTCVCANCHRMLHRGKTIFSISHLKNVIAAQKAKAH